MTISPSWFRNLFDPEAYRMLHSAKIVLGFETYETFAHAIAFLAACPAHAHNFAVIRRYPGDPYGRVVVVDDVGYTCLTRDFGLAVNRLPTNQPTERRSGGPIRWDPDEAEVKWMVDKLYKRNSS